MVNIETKVKLNNLDVAQKEVSGFASYVGNLIQKDSYFIVGNKRLKTREEPEQFELIYYDRPNTLKSKDSHYFRYHYDKPLFSLVKGILSVLFGVKKIVEKERYLYLYKNTRIHLDRVKNLGTFLELETVIKDNNSYEDFKKEHEDIALRLHLGAMEKILVSYSDLVTA